MTSSPFRGRIAATTALFAMQQCVAWSVAGAVTFPLLAPLARHPDGFWALYSQGGRVLGDFVRASTAGLTVAGGALALVAALWTFAWFALGATLPVLGVVEPAPSLHKAMSYSLRRLPTLAGLAALALGGYAVLGVAGFFAWSHGHAAGLRAHDLPAAERGGIVWVLPAVALAALVTAWHDVARVVAAGRGSGVLGSASEAVMWIARSPVRTLATGFVYALAGLCGPLMAYVLSRFVGGRDAVGAVVVLTLAQQCALAWRFGWRARWFYRLGEDFRWREASAEPSVAPSSEAPPQEPSA